jgi:hypothetical protein
MTTKITADNIADSAITSAKISDGTVTATDLAAGAGSTDWQAVIVADGSTVTTMVSGRGYFVNTTSAAGILKFPASASRGDYVEIKDYARTFNTNNLTVQRNGHKIDGTETNATVSTDGASIRFVYMDSTRGWSAANDDTTTSYGNVYTSATGGTITTSGDYKIHTFTGDGNFVVSQVGNPTGGGSAVSYLVVAGGGGSGGNQKHIQGGGGGGAGGFRENRSPGESYTVSPLDGAGDLTLSAQTYPITVGAGGSGGFKAHPGPGAVASPGSNSTFSTITSAGGGRGGQPTDNPPAPGTPGNPGLGQPGGSGGGNGGGPGAPSYCAGLGNNPAVSPAQGKNGAPGNSSNATIGGGGGGATNPGTQSPGPGAPSIPNPHIGAGATTHITGSPVTYSVGGTYGAGPNPWSATTASTANSGNGANGLNWGPSPSTPDPGGFDGIAGGKGVVILRYKYQN